MKRWLRYVAAAFNARPLGMPLPPNWFVLAAFAMLGALLHPGFYLIGLGLELAYLSALAQSKRFRAVVDATAQGRQGAWQERRQQMLAELPSTLRAAQEKLEQDCATIAQRLQALQTGKGHIDDLARLCWLHLRLLISRVAVAAVVERGEREAEDLRRQEARVNERLEGDQLDAALRASLQEQGQVIRRRREAHTEARRRLEVIDAELERIRQQAALVHEHALLANDAEAASDSVDVIAASLDEADRWLQEQQALFGEADELLAEQPDGSLFRLSGQ